MQGIASPLCCDSAEVLRRAPSVRRPDQLTWLRPSNVATRLGYSEFCVLVVDQIAKFDSARIAIGASGHCRYQLLPVPMCPVEVRPSHWATSWLTPIRKCLDLSDFDSDNCYLWSGGDEKFPISYSLKVNIMKSKGKLLSIAGVSVLILVACNRDEGTKAESGPSTAVAATVNGMPISVDRVDLVVKQAVAQGQQDGPDLRKGIIEHLALQKLFSIEAAKDGLEKSAEVQEQLEMSRQSILAGAYVKQFLKKQVATDDLLSAEYEKVKSAAPTEYRARHILVKTEAQARTLVERLNRDPKLFEEVAKSASMDPESKSKGGELGWFDPQQMLPEFSKAVANLKLGGITQEPVKSAFGYHVIQLEETRQGSMPPMEQIKPMLRQRLEQEGLNKLIDDTKAKSKIEIIGTSMVTAESQRASGNGAHEAPAGK